MEKMGGILLQHHQISPNYLAKAAFPGSFALHKATSKRRGITSSLLVRSHRRLAPVCAVGSPLLTRSRHRFIPARAAGSPLLPSPPRTLAADSPLLPPQTLERSREEELKRAKGKKKDAMKPWVGREGYRASRACGEFANWILLCPPRNSFSCSSLGSIRSEANGSPLPRTVNRRSKEELIAFFKSIQTSIAEESPRTSRRTRKQSSDPFEEVERRKQSYDGEPKALDLNDMKVAELRELARARRMKGYSRLKKSELIDRLKGA
uniref:Rho termination factor-like N-terminal domain-containing protein n=1 Tax=Oryza meridionalis TaxID=40149 RepID=A0A0E0BYT7_9ORYZ